MDLASLRKVVEREIDTYKYEVPKSSIGNPWSPEKVKTRLEKMRASLVGPYWVNTELRDTFEQFGQAKAAVRACAVVANDGNGTLLAFDPVEKEFVLIQMGKESFMTIGVRGDAVGCFLAI